MAALRLPRLIAFDLECVLRCGQRRLAWLSSQLRACRRHREPRAALSRQLYCTSPRHSPTLLMDFALGSLGQDRIIERVLTFADRHARPRAGQAQGRQSQPHLRP